MVEVKPRYWAFHFWTLSHSFEENKQSPEWKPEFEAKLKVIKLVLLPLFWVWAHLDSSLVSFPDPQYVYQTEGLEQDQVLLYLTIMHSRMQHPVCVCSDFGSGVLFFYTVDWILCAVWEYVNNIKPLNFTAAALIMGTWTSGRSMRHDYKGCKVQLGFQFTERGL